jgi:ring-1,2-phenylacetyl-CoA epoxidase subunit PaaD
MITLKKISNEEILEALEDVKDPEIPTISIVDLGIVTDVNVSDDNFVNVKLTPTFAGCPALKVMEALVKEKIKTLDVSGVEVKTTFDVQWNSDMITDKGREALKKHGLAPPVKHNGFVQIEVLERVKCPNCGSRNTELKTPF